MDPRISFSYDFVVSQQAIKHENIYREDPVSSDFEFSVKNKSMISADEVFFQGMLLPLKSDGSKKVTLRDELLVNDDDYEEDLPRLPKSSSRWKERLGLSRVSSKKDKNKNDGFPTRNLAITDGQREKSVSKDNMEMFSEGGVSCRGK